MTILFNKKDLQKLLKNTLENNKLCIRIFKKGLLENYIINLEVVDKENKSLFEFHPIACKEGESVYIDGLTIDFKKIKF